MDALPSVTVGFRQNMLVTLYLAFFVALIATVWFAMPYSVPYAARLMLAIAAMVVVVGSVPTIHFPDFRVVILQADGSDASQDAQARLAMLWGFGWRFLVTLPITSIVFGFGGAAAVMLYKDNHVFALQPWLYCIAYTVTTFIAAVIGLYLPCWWWLRMYGKEYRIGLVSAA